VCYALVGIHTFISEPIPRGPALLFNRKAK
jgi:hypothetical protein